MAIESIRLTPAEQALITEKRNRDCQEDNHLQGCQKLENGRLVMFCPNCLWAELMPPEKDNLRIGQTPIIVQMQNSWNPKP